jgi:hypothetical protein
MGLGSRMILSGRCSISISGRPVPIEGPTESESRTQFVRLLQQSQSN